MLSSFLLREHLVSPEWTKDVAIMLRRENKERRHAEHQANDTQLQT
jgi:hypothetical protein